MTPEGPESFTPDDITAAAAILLCLGAVLAIIVPNLPAIVEKFL